MKIKVGAVNDKDMDLGEETSASIQIQALAAARSRDDNADYHFPNTWIKIQHVHLQKQPNLHAPHDHITRGGSRLFDSPRTTPVHHRHHHHTCIVPHSNHERVVSRPTTYYDLPPTNQATQVDPGACTLSPLPAAGHVTPPRRSCHRRCRGRERPRACRARRRWRATARR